MPDLNNAEFMRLIDSHRIGQTPAVRRIEMPTASHVGSNPSLIFTEPVNFREVANLLIEGGLIWFDLPQPYQGPLIDCTDAGGQEGYGVWLQRTRIASVGALADCAVLFARSTPTVNSRWHRLDHVWIDGAFRRANVIYVGAELCSITGGGLSNTHPGAACLQVASTVDVFNSAEKLIASQFGPVAGDGGSVSQSSFHATGLAMTANGSGSSCCRFGRGCIGIRMDHCYATCHGPAATAYDLNDLGGAELRNVFLSGRVEGEAESAIRVNRPIADCHLRDLSVQLGASKIQNALTTRDTFLDTRTISRGLPEGATVP